MSNQALLVIDMTNDFVKPNGALPVPGAEVIVKNINKVITMFSKNGDPIIFSCDAHDQNDNEFKQFPVHCVKDTLGAEIYEKLIQPVNAIRINKKTFNSFDGTKLEEILDELDVQCLYIVGVATDICVKAAALSANTIGYVTMVIKEAVKGLTIEANDMALKEMADKRIYVISIANVKDMILQ